MSSRTVILSTCFASLLALVVHPLQSEPAKSSEGTRKLAAFTLKDPRDDKAVSFAAFKDSKAVVLVFLGTECPVSNAFLPVLAEMHARLHGEGRRISRLQRQSPGHAR